MEKPPFDPTKSVEFYGDQQKKVLDAYQAAVAAGNAEKVVRLKTMLGWVRGDLAEILKIENGYDPERIAADERFAEDSARVADITDPKPVEAGRGFGVNKGYLRTVRYRSSMNADRTSK